MEKEFTYQNQCNQFGVFEVCVKGPSTGNPFREQVMSGLFTSKQESVTTQGFYDGDGNYRIRFMPKFTGTYQFVIRTSFLKETISGKFYVNPAKENNHGPVRVHDTYHFAYTDGTPYVSIGTTCYVWHLQGEEMIEKTLSSLQEAGFNKIRFCIFPKHYNYNFQDPACFPYEGTPMDSSVLNEDNFMEYWGKKEGNNWNFYRFNPAYFQHIEKCIERLQEIGVEADLILMHPYDRWGFSDMPKAADDLYYQYIINRFAAYSNVWWSLANEFDLMPQKSMEDWERFGQTLVKYDPYQHLRSIHNCRLLFDHTKPWITHVSMQRIDLYKGAELTDAYRIQYGKPVVMDEIGYEGNIQFGWGDLTPEEMLRRFWETAIRGGYPGHGETYLSEDNKLWWSHGGKIKGESWKRFRLLQDVISAFPHGEIAPYMNEWDSVSAVPEVEWTSPVKSMYVYYYSFMRPSFRDFMIDENTHFHVEVIDTWNATITDAGVHCGKFRVQLPAKQYMAIRLTQTDEDLRDAVIAEIEEPVIVEEEEKQSIFSFDQPVEETQYVPEEVIEVQEEPIVEEQEQMAEEMVEEEEAQETEDEIPLFHNEEEMEEESEPEEDYLDFPSPFDEPDTTEEKSDFDEVEDLLSEVKKKDPIPHNTHDTSTIIAILDDLDELEDTAELPAIDDTDDFNILKTKR